MIKVIIKDNVILLFSSDLNVEHLQLLVFIFHNFSMAQRKALLTYCARVLIAVSDSSSVTALLKWI